MAALIQVSRVSIDHAMMTSVPLDALEELLVLEGMHAHSKFHRQFFRLWTPHVKYSSDVCGEGCNYTFPYAKHSHSIVDFVSLWHGFWQCLYLLVPPLASSMCSFNSLFTQLLCIMKLKEMDMQH